MPLNSGVVSAVLVPGAGCVSVTSGGVTSAVVIVKVFAELRPTFPAASSCSTRAV